MYEIELKKNVFYNFYTNYQLLILIYQIGIKYPRTG